jgi:hypothetical protein
VRITLRGARPPVWRLVLLPSWLTLPKVHQVFQIVMGWENYHLHDVTLEGTRGMRFEDPPRVITGESASPPEDVGGVSGYADHLEALADEDHPEHQTYVEWRGVNFDPHQLDIEAINARLAAWWKRVKKPDPSWLPILNPPPLEP